MQQMWCSGYRTDQGFGVVVATDQGVCQVWLPGEKQIGQVISNSHGDSKISRTAARQLEFYFQKKLQKFDITVDISYMSAFRRQILVLAQQIPYGTVMTYGHLAVLSGSAAAARAVGGALAANPVPVIIPCHRVIAASGALTGFSSAGGIAMKRHLLILEGVDFRGIKDV